MCFDWALAKLAYVHAAHPGMPVRRHLARARTRSRPRLCNRRQGNQRQGKCLQGRSLTSMNHSYNGSERAMSKGSTFSPAPTIDPSGHSFLHLMSHDTIHLPLTMSEISPELKERKSLKVTILTAFSSSVVSDISW